MGIWGHACAWKYSECATFWILCSKHKGFLKGSPPPPIIVRARVKECAWRHNHGTASLWVSRLPFFSLPHALCHSCYPCSFFLVPCSFQLPLSLGAGRYKLITMSISTNGHGKEGRGNEIDGRSENMGRHPSFCPSPEIKNMLDSLQHICKECFIFVRMFHIRIVRTCL